MITFYLGPCLLKSVHIILKYLTWGMYPLGSAGAKKRYLAIKFFWGTSKRFTYPWSKHHYLSFELLTISVRCISSKLLPNPNPNHPKSGTLAVIRCSWSRTKNKVSNKSFFHELLILKNTLRLKRYWVSINIRIQFQNKVYFRMNTFFCHGL